MIVLSEPGRAGGSVEFTRLSPPRIALASAATSLLARILDPDDEVRSDELRQTLPCPAVDGVTLVAPEAPAPDAPAGAAE